MPRPPIDGSVTLVTGASAGMGVEFARQLAPRVRALVLCARRIDRLNTLAAELRAAHPELLVSVHQADLCDRAACDAVLAAIEKELGPIGILINNAGMGDMGMYDLSRWEKVEQMIRINVLALSYLTWRVLPGMIARKKGGILNVSSGFGLQFLPGFAGYVATKHYVTAFTESIRLEARPHGVCITQVCPGPVRTEFNDVMGNFTPYDVPAFIEMPAATCVRKALRAFGRDQALLVPGLLMKLVMFLGATSPRFMRRLAYARIPGRLRRLQLLARAEKEQAQIGSG
jgi:short-subunit dehydrogenase